MRLGYVRSAGIMLVAAVALVGTASAATLWDQSTIDINGPGITASNSPGFGGFVRHSVDDVTVPAGGWMISSITQYYSNWNGSWVGGVTQGYVNIISKSGPLPAGVPSAVLVPMSASYDAPQFGQGVIAVTCPVSINLPAGDYWIGITPSGSAGISGANLMWPSAKLGDSVATYQAPGPWSNNYGNYDGAFKIEGEAQPVAAEPVTVSKIKAQYNQ